MEYLAQLLRSLTTDPLIFKVVFIFTVSVASFIFVMGILYLLSTVFDPVRRRLHSMSGGEINSQGGATSGHFSSTLDPLAGLTMPRKDWERNKVNATLVHAGIRAPNAINTFYAIKTILIILLPGTVLFLATLFPHYSTKEVAFAMIIATFLAVTMPDAIIESMARRRKRRLSNGFPDALDLLVVCTEAGLGLNQAIDRVAHEIEDNYPDLSQELKLVNVEIRAGVKREDALRDLAQRTGLEDIRGLVALLTQSMRLGTGVADTLRVYAEEFRDKRMQRAEELAAKIGTKMIFPLVLCLFPAFFVVILGPAYLEIIKTFGHI